MKRSSPYMLMTVSGLIFIMVIIGIILFTKQSSKGQVERSVKKSCALIEILIANPTIVSSIEKSNLNNQGLDKTKILELDQQWINSQLSDQFLESFMTNDAAGALNIFQKDHPEFKEIFITNALGLNVAMTNKTSDYYQADEQWWTDTYSLPRNTSILTGKIEYDESAKTWSYPIYATIKNDQQLTIGVLKAILDIREIRK